MRFSLLDDILTESGDVLLIVAASRKGAAVMSPHMRKIDRKSGGLLHTAQQNGFRAAAGQVEVLHAPAFQYKKIILIGRGEGRGADVAFAVADAVGAIGDAKSLTLLCDDDAGALVTAVATGAYRYKFGAAWPVSPPLSRVRVCAKLSARELSRAAAVGEGARLTRHLAEQPGNICTPTFLAQTARKMATMFPKLQARILNEKQMRTLKMGAFLAVSQGSAQPPKMIVLQYRGAAGDPVALVGKGVTFDTGGTSLKPGASMDEMKFDMGGAAAVLGAMLACARMRLPLHVVAVAPACENMPDGKAVKPGDVVRAMNGKTIEILNTDAEGRLILADALCYCARFRPAAVVDVATLTGACVIALGHPYSGMTSRDDKLAAQLSAAGESSGDNCWRLPMGPRYDKQLKTDYADLANIGGRSAGTITAACFLSHFCQCQSWAHLDIAGSAWTPKKRATGRPVPLLSHFLMSRAGRS